VWKDGLLNLLTRLCLAAVFSCHDETVIIEILSPEQSRIEDPQATSPLRAVIKSEHFVIYADHAPLAA
jgi:hypothetical protein